MGYIEHKPVGKKQGEMATDLKGGKKTVSLGMLGAVKLVQKETMDII